jgi:hypothetical protein
MTELDDLLTAAGSVGTASVATLTRARTKLDEAIRATGTAVPTDEADELLADGPDAVIPLQPVRAKTRRRPTVWLTAAAVAAALAVTSAVVWTATRTESSPPGGNLQPVPLVPITAKQLTVPFAIAKSTGVTLWSTSVYGDGALPTFELADRRSTLNLSVLAGEPKREAGATSVVVHGVPGWYIDEGALPGAPADDPGIGDSPPRRLIWEYEPGHWARLESLTKPPVSQARMTVVASGLTFGKNMPVRSAIKITAAPDGRPLTGFASVERDSQRTDGWLTNVIFLSDQATHGILVSVSPRGTIISPDNPAGFNTADALPVTVSGHAGYYSANSHRLTLGLGDGAYLDVADTGEQDAPDPITYDELVAVARSVTVASNPADPTTWFAAADALLLD